jgi:hypothetical protein
MGGRPGGEEMKEGNVAEQYFTSPLNEIVFQPVH